MAIRDLDQDSLVKRLGELLGNERNVQVEFLLHLGEFARRKGYEKLGYKNLWTYCHKKLRLAEATAFRRAHGAILLRKYPYVEAYLRDGRLCTTRLVKLEKILTPENARRLFDRASGATKREIEELVAEVAPRPAPKPLLRKLPQRARPAPAATATDSSDRKLEFSSEKSGNVDECTAGSPPGPSGSFDFSAHADPDPGPSAGDVSSGVEPPRPDAPGLFPKDLHADARTIARAAISEVVPLSPRQYLLRIGVDKEFVDELELGLELYSHVLSPKDYAGFIAISVHEFVEKLAKRKGAMAVRTKKAPDERRAANDSAAPAPATSGLDVDVPATVVSDGDRAAVGVAAAPLAPRSPSREVERMKEFVDAAARATFRITMATKRFVWERDGGCCQWPLADGGICGSRQRIQFDHILAKARGGTSDASNLRLLCAEHNAQHAREDFGDALIESKKRAAPAASRDLFIFTSGEDDEGPGTVGEAELAYGRPAPGLPPVEVFGAGVAGD